MQEKLFVQGDSIVGNLDNKAITGKDTPASLPKTPRNNSEKPAVNTKALRQELSSLPAKAGRSTTVNPFNIFPLSSPSGTIPNPDDILGPNPGFPRDFPQDSDFLSTFPQNNLIEIPSDPTFPVGTGNPIGLPPDPTFPITPGNPIGLPPDPTFPITPGNPIELPADPNIPATGGPPIGLPPDPTFPISPSDPIELPPDPIIPATGGPIIELPPDPTFPTEPSPEPCGCSDTPPLPKPTDEDCHPEIGVDAGETGSIVGDPHFTGFDGERYDIQGEDGKIYNLLSDKGIQVNGKFSKVNGNTTVVSEMGIKIGSDKIEFKAGKGKGPKINGKEMKKGEMVKLSDGSTAKWDGTNLNISTQEYNINIKDNGSFLDTNFKITDKGVASDCVMPHGLLGQTADGNDDTRKTTGTEGKGVIEGSVKDYEVKDLFSDDFKHNRNK